jgi:predicted dinucleotide-binding enzyme
MEIGIIGAGQIGGTLTLLLTKLGHTVRVANSRDPQTLSDLAGRSGARAVWASEAATDVDLLIVSIPQKSVPALAPGVVKAAKAGAPIIETNNYYPQRDGYIEEIENGTPESVWVSSYLGAPVFKVFNGIYWQHLLEGGLRRGAAGRVALPIAGDDPEGKQIVFALVDDLGFDPVDGGPLVESWRQQPGTPVYGADLDAAGVKGALLEALPARPAEFRAQRPIP